MRIKTIKNLNIVLIVLLVIAIIIIVNLIQYYGVVEKLSEKKIEISKLDIAEDPLSLKGFSEVNISVNSPTAAIILTEDCKSIIMTTTEQQIYSIQKGLEERTEARPTTHDLIEDTLENFGIKVLMVKIVTLKEGTYYANLILKKENKILNLDAKPSDSIAIAVRTNAPVYVKKSLLTQYGQKTC